MGVKVRPKLSSSSAVINDDCKMIETLLGRFMENYPTVSSQDAVEHIKQTLGRVCKFDWEEIVFLVSPEES